MLEWGWIGWAGDNRNGAEMNPVRLLKTIAAGGLAVVTAYMLMPQTSAAEDAGRYVLQRTTDGFIRLDTATGDTAHCSLKQAAWRCDSLDGGTALRQELQRLSDENKRLKARIETLETSKAAQAPRSSLPSEAEFSRIMDFMEMAMRRFMEFARDLKGEQDKEI